MSIQPGTRLGPYEVQDVLGQGAMGVVYRAYHAQLERTGAVKVLQGIAPDVDSTARFRHEAQAIAQMRHPNILNVFDFGEFEGTPYMIIEYVPGGSLASRMKQGPMEIPVALDYLHGIAAGLDYAHSLGIVHRDVKPANVLLEKDGTPVIADFGLVKLMQSTSLRSMTGVTTGTPAYMAPEQVTGSHAGPAADRYSLATIAYEMLTGVIPFDGGGLMEVLYAQVHRDPPTPSSRRPELGPAVDAVVMRGMAKDPNARWESCETFVDALEKALSKVTAPVLARTAVMSPFASTVPMVAPLAAATVALPETPAVTASPSNVGLPTTPPRTNGVNAGATVAMAYPAPTQPVAKKKSRRRLFSLGAAAVLVLLLIGAFAVCAARPSVSLSPSTVVAGESVLVTATRAPANQVGEIQLHSTVHIFAFHADANGGFKQSILIPRTIGAGDHTVQICWGSACHASATLHVIAPVAFVTDPPGSSPLPGVTPSPGAPSPSPGASPQPTTAPGTTPRPAASPTPTSRPAPVPSPSPAPQPSPTPTPAPKPTPTPTPTPPPPPPPTPAPFISLDSISSLGNTTMTFHYFYAGSATITIHQGGTSKSVTMPVAAGSSTRVIFKTPSGFLVTAQPLVPQAYVTVGSMTSNSANVTL